MGESKKHAILSPSGASRWLACTPSARLEQRFPDKRSAAADEGTLAHDLGEKLIALKAGRMSQADFDAAFVEIEKSEYYDNAMWEHAENYAVFVMERYNEALQHTEGAMLFLERKIDLTEFIPEGFGTGDTFIIADNVLDFIDLKYGKGVPVSAVNNSQMKVYALGALREFEFSFDIHTVRMTIYQPRLDNISTWEIAVDDLHKWAAEELVPRAKMAFSGEGEYVPGGHCQFCRARAKCKALADHNLEIGKYDFQQADLLTEEGIADILSRASAFTSWIGAVEEYALAEAVKNGTKWPGFKLVEGRSNRVITDPEKAAEKLTGGGFTEDKIYAPKKLLGITDLEKLVGKKILPGLIGDLIVKPTGKPTLVPQDDKRPELNSAESAAADFKDIQVE